MSTIQQGEKTGLRDPYRTLLILFWGALMALAALAGQIGGPNELRISGGSTPTESHVRSDGPRLSKEKSAPTALLGY